MRGSWKRLLLAVGNPPHQFVSSYRILQHGRLQLVVVFYLFLEMMMGRNWTRDVAVVVCGVEDGKITENGTGVQKFASLADARAVFADLDPNAHTARFTWAMGNPEKDDMRFETRAAYKLYST
jgi:hypothetical protein